VDALWASYMGTIADIKDQKICWPTLEFLLSI
jgi:hypothetical protein